MVKVCKVNNVYCQIGHLLRDEGSSLYKLTSFHSSFFETHTTIFLYRHRNSSKYSHFQYNHFYEIHEQKTFQVIIIHLTK